MNNEHHNPPSPATSDEAATDTALDTTPDVATPSEEAFYLSSHSDSGPLTPVSDLVKEQELLVFTTCISDCFETVKGMRQNLQHPENVTRAATFAKVLNRAWWELCGDNSYAVESS